MIKHAAKRLKTRSQRWWPTPSGLLAATALFVVLGGSAAAATGLIQARDIAPGAVTGRAIRAGAVEVKDLGAATRAMLASGRGSAGATGNTGAAGAPGASGVNGANGPDGAAGTDGANGANGPAGAAGTDGANGANGPDGANGANGADGTNGTNGTNGVDGAKGADGSDGANGANGPDGANGTNGTNGTITPLSATQGSTALPTGAASTTVVSLAVPAGSYVVLAKTELSQTGAGDSVECLLKSGALTIDQAGMKTMPALAAVPASLQAVITATSSPTELSLQCSVAVANGTANFNSLIAIPTA
jgi:hypothetical protein